MGEAVAQPKTPQPGMRRIRSTMPNKTHPTFIEVARRRLVHAARCLLWGSIVTIAACAQLPPRPPAPVSHALATLQDAALAKAASADRAEQGQAPSGFRLLPTGEFALDARLALARRAEHSLDLQYYDFHDDTAGRALLRELRDAAARGVRVRLLVDDFYAAQVVPLLHGLAAHPGVEVRLFNPLSWRSGGPLWRLALSSGPFELRNHRMHNKLMVADNSVAVAGGRNIGDEYFMRHREANFIDLDVLCAGGVVPQLSAAFDSYWNSEVVWPLSAASATAGSPEQLRQEFDAQVRAATPPEPGYRLDPLRQTTVTEQLAQGRLQLHWAAAEVHVDPPSKALRVESDRTPTQAMGGLLNAMAQARSDVMIVSPYFVPSEIGMGMMREGRARGGKTIVITNSLASTDEPLVYEKYSAYRLEMLKMGVELYEVSPQLTTRSQSLGNFGSSTPRLHAKVAIVDKQKLLVGSVNLDARSASGNTELGLVIDSPVLAQQAAGLLSGTSLRNLHKLRLASNGQSIEWLADDGQGGTEVLTEEPHWSLWQWLKLKVLSSLVDERLL